MKQRSVFNPFFSLVLVMLVTGCVSLKRQRATSSIEKKLKTSQVFSSQFTGFALYDPEAKEFLVKHNSDLLFTPASNTKILTALTSIEAIGDSIPTFLYRKWDDSVYLRPFGDPTLLHPDFQNQPIINKLKNQSVLINFPEHQLPHYGSGWAWDDYEFDYQTERSWLPVYGNELWIFNRDSLHVIPDFFVNYVTVNKGLKPGSRVYREREFNLFNVWVGSDETEFERKIPFEYSEELAVMLLSDTLDTAVVTIAQLPDGVYDTLYNQPFIPVLALMMQRSDNFLAEQLLIVSAALEGYPGPGAFRSRKLQEWDFISSPVRWVDGSGLSRYNLISPEALVSVVNKIYQKLEWDEIKMIFPAGGESGTLSNWYNGSSPYVYAKTGTLSNNHNLSGFLLTKSGKTLIFSLMNNHYLRSEVEVKYEMQELLELVRDQF